MAYMPPGRRRSWNKASELLLKEVGLVRRSTARVCGIRKSLEKAGSANPRVGLEAPVWHPVRSGRAADCGSRRCSEVNITNFVNLLDVFNDLLLDAVYRADGGVGTYNLGRIGSALGATTSRFAIKYPAVHSYANEVHQKRSESMGSHPLVRGTRRPTGRFPIAFCRRCADPYYLR